MFSSWELALFRRCDFIGRGIDLLEEMCHCGGVALRSHIYDQIWSGWPSGCLKKTVYSWLPSANSCSLASSDKNSLSTAHWRKKRLILLSVVQSYGRNTIHNYFHCITYIWFFVHTFWWSLLNQIPNPALLSLPKSKKMRICITSILSKVQTFKNIKS
jgi:hypothetical protein